MTLLEQFGVGLIIIALEVVLINIGILCGLRDQWKGLDNDPQEVGETE